MTGRGVRLLRVRGVEIRVHPVWLVLGPILVASLALVELPFRQPAWSDELRWIVATIGAFGFLGTVVVHELAHLQATIAVGAPRRNVVVHLFGAPAPLDGVAGSHEVFVALAGPLASVAVALALLAAAVVLPRAGLLADAAREVLLLVGILSGIVGTLTLVPVPPLDGARAVRAVVLARSHDPVRADRSVIAAGRLVGLFLAAAGAVLAITGDPVTGVLLFFLGFSVRGSMGAYGRRRELEGLIASATVGDAMERDLPAIPAQLTLDTFATQLEGPGDLTAVPVMDGEHLLGVVGLRELGRAGRARWPSTRAGQAMTPASKLPVVRPGDRLSPAVELLFRARSEAIPVFDGDRLAGLLTRYGVGRLVRERAVARAGAAGGASQSPP